MSCLILEDTVPTVGSYAETPDQLEVIDWLDVQYSSEGQGAWVTLVGCFNAETLRHMASQLDRVEQAAKNLCKKEQKQ